MELFATLVSVLDSTARLTVPLMLAALAGMYSERSGVFDIGLEGKMLIGAFAAGTIAYSSGSAWLGLSAAMLISTLFALLHGFASITVRGNQIVSGVAINFLAAGTTALLGQNWFHEGGRTPQLPNSARFLGLQLPGAEALRDVPVLGPLYFELISGHNIIVYLSFVLVPLSWWVLYRTRFGLRLRAVGQNPAAVDTAGVSVVWLRYRAVICAGLLCGVAGAYIALAQSAGFLRDMTAGRGFIALAALIFAKWRPVPVMLTCILFGFLEATANRLQGTRIEGIGEVPVQIFQALPYLLTVILLAGFIGTSEPPRAGGVPYVKER
jgi:simple sugar transport system permease protein